MDEFGDDIAKAVFDRTMFNTLLVEFLREINLPFVVVHNSKFKAIFRFICPGLQLPTHEDLIKLNVNNYITFKYWQNISNSESLNEERLTKVEKWAREELENGKNPKSQKPQSIAELLQIDLASGTSSIREFQGEDNSLWTSNTQVKYSNEGHEIQYETEAPVDHDYGNVMMAGDTIEDRNPNLEDFGQDSQDSRFMEKEIKEENVDEYFEERKPSAESLGFPDAENSASTLKEVLPSTSQDSNFIGREIKEENVQDYFEEEKPAKEFLGFPDAEHSPSMLKEVKTEEAEEVEEEEEKKLVINYVPGLVKWPCFVCSQQKESKQLRDVSKMDARFMMYICTKTGQYSMKYAKELARMKSFKICVSHLSRIYDDALDVLNIVEPRHDIVPENQKIIDMYHAVKLLKDPSYNSNDEYGTKNMWPIVNCIRRFFTTYGRHNYVKNGGNIPKTTDNTYSERGSGRYKPY